MSISNLYICYYILYIILLLNRITYFLKGSPNSFRTTSYMVHFFSVGSASSDKQPKSVSLCSHGRFDLYFLISMTIARDETNTEALVFRSISLWDNISAFSFNFGSKRSIKTFTKKFNQKTFSTLLTTQEHSYIFRKYENASDLYNSRSNLGIQVNQVNKHPDHPLDCKNVDT